MPDTTNIGLRIPDDLLSRVDALKDEQGISRTEAIISLIQKGLGLDSPKSEQAPADVLGRLEALEKKVEELAAVQQSLGSVQQPALNKTVDAIALPSPPVQQNPAAVKQPLDSVKQSLQPSNPVALLNAHRQQHTAPQGTEEGIRADGQRWLTTTQAWERATERGYEASKAAFRGWSQRNSEQLRSQFGLVQTGYSGKSNAMASFEDLLGKRG